VNCKFETCKAVFKDMKENDERDLFSLCFQLEKCEFCVYRKQVEPYKKDTYKAVEAEYRRLYNKDKALMIKVWSSL